jgi:hypothetical protein
VLPADPTHQLYFPHIGEGGLAGTPPRFPQTSLILVNTTRKAVQGRIEFCRDSGSPLELTIGSQTASSFSFSMTYSGVLRFVTSGEGDLVSGWAMVRSDQPLI